MVASGDAQKHRLQCTVADKFQGSGVEEKELINGDKKEGRFLDMVQVEIYKNKDVCRFMASLRAEYIEQGR